MTSNDRESKGHDLNHLVDGHYFMYCIDGSDKADFQGPCALCIVLMYCLYINIIHTQTSQLQFQLDG